MQLIELKVGSAVVSVPLISEDILAILAEQDIEAEAKPNPKAKHNADAKHKEDAKQGHSKEGLRQPAKTDTAKPTGLDAILAAKAAKLKKSEIRKSIRKAAAKPKEGIEEKAAIAGFRRAVNSAYDNAAADFYNTAGRGISYSYTRNVKDSPYVTEWDDSARAINLDVQREEDFFNPKFDESLFREVIRAAKIKNLYGIDVYVNPIKKSMFEDWKIGHTLDSWVWYDMVNI